MPEDTEHDKTDYSSIWALDTDSVIKDKSWFWWWWIFFLEDEEHKDRTKQLMILWSMKYTDDIKVMDKHWSLDNYPEWDDGTLEFNGMVAAWWYDGEEMHDPLLLKDMDFKVEHHGKEGGLYSLSENQNEEYSFYGSPKKYTVEIKDEERDFHFELTPWNPYLQKHRYNAQKYGGDYSYNIQKVYGMKLDGTIEGEKTRGSGYFQRVCVNAPAAPWYWGLVHCEDGSFIHYFNPFIGPQIFRKKKKNKSWLDWGDISLSKSVTFYHRDTNREFKFKKGKIKIDHTIKNRLPVFDVRGEDKRKKIHLRLKAYSRAYWRFEEPRKYLMKPILYYNEYPSQLVDFKFALKDGSLEVDKEDLGKTSSNLEHTWGKII